MHTGIVASILSNIYRKKNSHPVSPDDFMLVDPATHRERQAQKTFDWLKSMARKADG